MRLNGKPSPRNRACVLLAKRLESTPFWHGLLQPAAPSVLGVKTCLGRIFWSYTMIRYLPSVPVSVSIHARYELAGICIPAGWWRLFVDQ